MLNSWLLTEIEKGQTMKQQVFEAATAEEAQRLTDKWLKAHSNIRMIDRRPGIFYAGYPNTPGITTDNRKNRVFVSYEE
jgi:hypothetical protein